MTTQTVNKEDFDYVVTILNNLLIEIDCMVTACMSDSLNDDARKIYIFMIAAKIMQEICHDYKFLDIVCDKFLDKESINSFKSLNDINKTESFIKFISLNGQEKYSENLQNFSSRLFEANHMFNTFKNARNGNNGQETIH